MNDRFDDQPIDHSTDADTEQPLDLFSVTGNPIEALIEHLDVQLSQELHAATSAIIDGLMDDTTNEAQLKLAWTEYAKLTEHIVESVEATPENPQAYAKAQIAVIIHKALIFGAAGKTLRYLEELDHAEVYAYNEELDYLSTGLNFLITTTLETQDMSSEILILKLKGVIDESNREYLRDRLEEGDDFEDMVNHAYGMILEEGQDPDEILTELGVIERE